MRTAGDPLPESLASYYRSLDAGLMADATAAFTEDAVYAVPRPGDHETDPRRIITGHHELKAYFDERGLLPYSHLVLVCVCRGADALLEGVSLLEGNRHQGFVASVQLSPEGRIARYLAWRVDAPIEPPPAPDGPERSDAEAVVARYFTALKEARFEDAAACFSKDCIYSHPPYKHTNITDPGRIDVKGRPALLANFQRRGPASFGYRMDVFIQRGPNALFEQGVVDLPGGGEGTAMGSLTMGEDGLIRRYAAFYCEPAVPRLGARPR